MSKQANDESDSLELLHTRLVAGDRTAPELIARNLLEAITGYLRAKFPHIDDHFLQQAAADSVLDYCERPDRYNPKLKKDLKQYVEMIAWRKAANLSRDEQRQQRAQREAIEFAKKNSRRVVDDPSAGKWIEEEIDAYLKVLPDKQDRDFMRLVTSDVTDVGQLAASLGLQNLPPDKMRAEVKKAKDRIRAVLRRKGRQ